MITVATPAYNGNEVELSVFSKNFEFVQEIKQQSSPINGGTTSIYIYKNPENPANTKLTKHIHLWNKEDKVAGDIAIGSDDFYKSNGVTENVEIPVGNEYNDVVIPILHGWPEFVNAHGFDANRPQLIYKMLLESKINIIK